ncbi:hypothetical protein C8T65DRAFT_738474 [Cerioporus squamosus]|nr:hypothetical protein C8T65DRAFT_738474 [Cerioporus squamosus]
MSRLSSRAQSPMEEILNSAAYASIASTMNMPILAPAITTGTGRPTTRTGTPTIDTLVLLSAKHTSTPTVMPTTSIGFFTKAMELLRSNNTLTPEELLQVALAQQERLEELRTEAILGTVIAIDHGFADPDGLEDEDDVDA